MTRDFGFYEYAGIIIPGAVLGAGILWLTPEGRALITHEGFSFGALGLFVILAYALGQLVQGVGNGIEWAWWKAWGGRPTEQVLAGKLLSTEQHARLVGSLAQYPNVPRDTSQLSTSERLAIVREVQSVVAAAGRDKRVETFLGNYGLLRGLAASFLVLTVLTLMLGKGRPRPERSAPCFYWPRSDAPFQKVFRLGAFYTILTCHGRTRQRAA